MYISLNESNLPHILINWLDLPLCQFQKITCIVKVETAK
jgi:hypothetical protein